MLSFAIGDKIGQGSYGTIFECTTNIESLVVKITKPDAKGIGALLEASIMKTYIHPNINSCKYALYKDSYFHIFQERAVCDLRSAVTLGVPSARLSVEWFSHLLTGLDVLHSESIIHCDIKPDNVLVCEGNILKLTDFTHSVISVSRKFSHRVGSLYYSAPEVIGRREWGKKIDIWSLGCTFYFILTGTQLVPRQEGERCVYEVLENLRIDIEAPPEIRRMIQSMLSFEPSDRPSVSEIIRKGIIKVERRGYIIDAPRRTERDERIYARMLSLVGDKEIASMASTIHRRTMSRDGPSISPLLRLETCVWIAHKVILGSPPSLGKFFSQLHSILDAEVSICEYLNFRLHVTV